MNQQPNVSPLNKADIVDSLIDAASQQIEDGEIVDLTDLNIRVKELCDAITHTPPEDTEEAKGRLNSIVYGIEGLEKKLTALITEQEKNRGS